MKHGLNTDKEKQGSEFWNQHKVGNAAGLALYNRHYSAYQYRDGRVRKLFVGPGEKMVLLSPKNDALFVWRKFRDASGQVGLNCVVFRNESNIQSSVLIKDAMRLAWQRWPGIRLYTYVNPRRIRSTNPGCCFKKAGWDVCGVTKERKLIILSNSSPNPCSIRVSSVAKERASE